LSFTRRFFRRVAEAETLPSLFVIAIIFVFLHQPCFKLMTLKKIHPSKREKAARKSLTAALIGRVFYSIFNDNILTNIYALCKLFLFFLLYHF